MRVIVLTDNIIIFKGIYEIIEKNLIENVNFDFYCSPSSKELFQDIKIVNEFDIKADYKTILNYADLIISCHCKKIFPSELVNNVRCINIHPGLNPYNRGWYPQVFAINNGLPHGATIHVMDEDIDHGEIICQKEVKIYNHDTSDSVYKRVVETELELFENNFKSIITGNYKSTAMINEGNYNSIKDFKKVCELDMNKIGTFKEFYNILRSLTHKPYSNAYFYDNGDKIFISLNIERKEDKKAP